MHTQDDLFGFVYHLRQIAETFNCSLCLQVHAASTPAERNLVLLDAAAYVPTHRLDLKAAPADFVAMSFYKMFGYPTGLGALVFRTDVVPMLQKVGIKLDCCTITLTEQFLPQRCRALLGGRAIALFRFRFGLYI